MLLFQHGYPGLRHLTHHSLTALQEDTTAPSHFSERESPEFVLPLSVRPLHRAEFMEEPLAGESGCQQVLVLGDEVLNDLLLQPSSLEKHQQALSFHTANGLYSQAMKTLPTATSPGKKRVEMMDNSGGGDDTARSCSGEN